MGKNIFEQLVLNTNSGSTVSRVSSGIGPIYPGGGGFNPQNQLTNKKVPFTSGQGTLEVLVSDDPPPPPPQPYTNTLAAH